MVELSFSSNPYYLSFLKKIFKLDSTSLTLRSQWHCTVSDTTELYSAVAVIPGAWLCGVNKGPRWVRIMKKEYTKSISWLCPFTWTSFRLILLFSPFWWCDDLDLHGWRSQCRHLLLHAVSNSCPQFAKLLPMPCLANLNALRPGYMVVPPDKTVLAYRSFLKGNNITTVVLATFYWQTDFLKISTVSRYFLTFFFTFLVL